MRTRDARIVFESEAEDLVPADHNGWCDVYVRDLTLNQTRLLSENQSRSGSGNGLSVANGLSADGNTVVFYSAACDLIANDLNGAVDIFVTRIIDTAGDTDADGLPDDWERIYFQDLTHGPNEDADGDGASNLVEWKAGTNPIDPQSALRVLALDYQAEAGPRIFWTAVPGRTYRVQSKTSLQDAAWSDLTGDIAPAEATAQTDVVSTDQSTRYFRVVLIK